jgi:hypothetical protein
MMHNASLSQVYKSDLPGLPRHKRRLKENLHDFIEIPQPIGLCNGTRLMVLRVTMRVIHAEILTGPGKGEQVLIPESHCPPSEGTSAFHLEKKAISSSLAFLFDHKQKPWSILSICGGLSIQICFLVMVSFMSPCQGL